MGLVIIRKLEKETFSPTRGNYGIYASYLFGIGLKQWISGIEIIVKCTWTFADQLVAIGKRNFSYFFQEYILKKNHTKGGRGTIGCLSNKKISICTPAKKGMSTCGCGESTRGHASKSVPLFFVRQQTHTHAHRRA